MSIKFSEALENDILSASVIKSIQPKCKCGSEIVFSDSLRTAMCSNKNCVYKIVNRFKSINSKLSLGISDISIENIVKKLKLVTPYQLFLLKDAVNQGIITSIDVNNLSEILDNIEKAQDRHYKLYEIVQMCGVPTLENVAIAVFKGFDTIAEAYDEIEKGQVSFVSERLGLATPDSTTLGVEIYDKLVEYMEEFAFAEMQLNIDKAYENKLNIAFCDNIIPFINKAEYIEYINSLTKFKFNYICSISDTTDILIRNSSENNSKIRAARIINDKFVADAMNSGELNLCDINVVIDGELKPIGSKVLVCSSDELISKLLRLEDKEKHGV